MKRALLSVLLLSSGAAARAEESAYLNLIGMAESAASDPGPDAGDIPQAVPRRPGARASREERQQSPVLAVSPRAPSAWTRLFSSLTPSWRAPRRNSFVVRVEVSSAAVTSPPVRVR